MEGEAGRIAAITVYPVRSLGGSRRSRVDIGPAGPAGDRAYAVVGAETGEVLRGRDAPELAGVAATGDPAADAAAVTAALGMPVRVEPAPDRGSGAAVHLVSRQALERAAAGQVPAGCSAEDPRANLLLSLGPDTDERTWVGRRLRIGSARLEVTRLPRHCLGVYAEVLEPGSVAVGDPVLLDGPAGA